MIHANAASLRLYMCLHLLELFNTALENGLNSCAVTEAQDTLQPSYRRATQDCTPEEVQEDIAAATF